MSYLLSSYNELNALAEKLFGGSIFLELTKNDEHYLKSCANSIDGRMERV